VAERVQISIHLSEENLRDLDARAKARGCSRSAEVAHLLRSGGEEEPPQVTVARLYAQAATENRLAAESRERASKHVIETKQTMLGQRLSTRYNLAALKAGRPVST
jgi:hypothetical protein